MFLFCWKIHKEKNIVNRVCFNIFLFFSAEKNLASLILAFRRIIWHTKQNRWKQLARLPTVQNFEKVSAPFS